MWNVTLLKLLGIGCCCCALGVQAQEQLSTPPLSPTSQAQEIVALKAEVERLKSIVPGQAVAMTQVAYNFSNLWFAAQEQNWPLARFYFNETRFRLRWAVNISPVRNTRPGELALQPVLDAFQQSHLASLGATIEEQDLEQFATLYEEALNGCYGCHTASRIPFLRLHIPVRPAEEMINFSIN